MSTPMDWQPSKAIQAKTGATKKKTTTIPRWVENPKGRSRQKLDDENKNEKEIKNMQKHWPQMRCPKHLRDCSNKRQYHSDCFFLRFYYFLPSSDGLDVSSSDGIPRTGTFASTCPSASHYVPNIPMICLSLRNSVYKLPIIMHSQAFIHA